MNSIRLSSLSAPVSGVFRLVSLLCLALPLLAAPAREVVFVDGAVAGHEALVAGVRPGVETVRLDPSGNALAQMAAWAETHSGYEAIHVVSHAAPGALRLGGVSLDGAALCDPAVAGPLAQLGRALNRGGDLLLYGCELAKGEAGAQFVAELAQVTGADVGASDNQTGAAAKGGDWVLEVAAGAIEARSLALGDFQGVLSTITFLEADPDLKTNGLPGVPSVTRIETVSGQAITLAAASLIFFDTSGIRSMDSTGNHTHLEITAPAGYCFDLTSFQIQGDFYDLALDLTSADGSTDSVTLNQVWGDGLYTPEAFTPAIGVTKVVFTSTYLFIFNHFEISNVRQFLKDASTADSFPNLTGTLTAMLPGTLSPYGIAAATAGEYSLDSGSYSIGDPAATYTVRATSAYGVLYVDGTSGAYAFVPNAAAIDALASRTEIAFNVTATASGGGISPATLRICLYGVNDTPEITSATTVNVIEHSTGTVYTVTASDRDAGQAVTYSLSGTDAGLFEIDEHTGAVRFKVAPDFEAPTDSGGDNVYDITVAATDSLGGSSASQAVAITVTDNTTAPAVATIARTQPGPVTLAETLEWRVTFTESVTGVDPADFELTPVDGAATATLGTVTPGANAAEYFVTATGVAGVGTLRLDVKSSGTGILDAESNALSGGFIHGQPYTRTLGTVPVAWGYNSYGQLGLGSKDYNPHSLPVVAQRTGALAGKTMVSIAAGYSHSLALCSDGTLVSWGSNRVGQMGDGTTDDSLTPVAVNTSGALAGKTVVAISVGSEYSLALCSDGKVYAWGWNYYSQLGNGEKTTEYSTPTPTPVAVDTTGALAGKTVVAISAGSSHSLALCSDGTLVAWGVNNYGQLGNGSTDDSPTPVAVKTDTGALAGKTVVAIAAGSSHSVALCRDGTLASWGLNNFGQLGDGSTTSNSTPVAVVTTVALSGKNVVSVAAGTNYSVALCSDGTAAIWGWNTYGQLGDGTTDDRHTPVAVDTTGVLAGKTVVAITPGSNNVLALCSDGTVAVWGRNEYGQLGNGATDNSFTPVAINAVAGSALVSRSVSLLMSSVAASHNFAFVSATAVISVATPTAGTYKAGDTLTFTLSTNGAATVDTTVGTPRLALTIGTETRYATYDAASSTSTSLVFTYTLATDDTDADGLAVASAIDLNGGTITDAFSLSIELSLPVYTLPVIAIDTTPPAVPAITSTAPAGTTASAAYTLTGTAEAGVTVKIYNAGSLVDTVTADAEGHWSCALTLADGATALTVTASDAVGNESAAVADTSWTIDTTAPEVATIARTQPGPVTPADTLEWRVTFTESVTGVDMADFELKSVDGAATATLGTVTPELTKTGVAGVQYRVTATGVAGIGTLRLDVKSGGTGIADALGHVMTEGHTYGQSYTHALGTVPVIWGKNDYGQLGLGSSDAAAHPLPAFVLNTGALAGKTVVALAVGGGHTLALTSEGKVYAWGRNEAGQVGNGTTDSPLLTPVEVIGLGVTETRKVVAIAAGGSHSVALFNDGTVYSWGWNNYGQLGSDTPSGSSYSRSTTPAAAKVDPSSALHDKTVVGIAAGMNYTLALCSDGTLAAWGYNNYGQLGNGTSNVSATPTPVAVVRDIGSALHGKTVVAIAAASRFSAALCSDGTVATWGQSGSGELGDGTTGDAMSRSTIPVAVKTDSSSALHGKTVVGVALGASHALALCADGDGALSLASWGMNNYGQLGIGTLETPKATPMAVKTDSSSALAGKSVVGLAVGSYHSLALCADGTLATWGRNDSGQLGDGTTTNRDTPKAINDSNNLDLAGSALLGRTPYLLAPGSYAYHSAVLVSPAQIDSVATPTAGAYKAGDTLSFTLTTKQPVTVTGTPRLALTLGTETRYATYDSGSGTTSLVFTYTVADGDTDADGLAVAGVIDLNGGTITDASSWSIALALPAYELPVILVDTTAPDSPVITSLSSTAIGGTAEPGATVEVFHEGTSLGTTTADAEGHWSLTISPLADGDYSLTAQATDAALNTGTASSAGTYTVDTVAPALTSATLISDNATPTLAKAGDVVTLNFTADETLQTPTVTLVGESVTASYDSGTSTWTATHTVAAGDAEGDATFSIAYRDVAGNAGTTVSATTDSSAVTIDLTAPETTIDSAPGAWTGSLVMFEFAGEDGAGSGVASYEVSVNAADFAPANFREFFSDLPDGPYTLAVRAIDAAGNVDATPATFTWTVDTVAPTLTAVTLVSSNATPTLAKAGDTVALSFAASETLQAPTVTLIGESVTASYDNESGQWRATHTVAAGDAEVAVTFSIAYRDESGLAGLAVNATTDSSAVTIDLTAPETTFDGTPGAWAVSRLVMFDFIGEDGAGSGVASYEVSLDGADFAPSNVRAFFSGLADGPHTLAVCAVDAAGNVDATPAVHRWTVDTIAPVAPTIASITSTGVSGRAEAGTTVEVFNGSTSMGTATADADGTWSLAVTLVDGTYALTATSTDAAGHRTSTAAATTRTVDTVNPTLTAVTLVSSNATATLAKAGETVTLRFRANETLQTPTVTLAGEPATASYDSGTSTWTAMHTVVAGDAEGSVAFSITFSDVAGNAGTPVTATTDSSVVTIDLTAPETMLTSQPASLSASATATFTFTGTGAVRYEASLDGAAYAAATSPVNYTGLSDGPHTFDVRAIDAAGNVDATPASCHWTIDVTPPEAPPAPDVPATSTQVSGRAEAGSTVTVYLDGVTAGTVQVGADGSWAYALPPTLSEGEHEIAYTVTDAAGNVSEVSAPAVFQVERLSRFAALSARAYAGAGEETLILGFVFAGNGKTTLVRGVGPGLAASVEGCLADPQLHLYAGDGTPVADNDDWAGTPALSGAFARTGAGALVADSKDAALLAALPGRLYTAHVSGAGGGRGVALAEAYDADLADTSGRLAALSVRSQVRAGDEILIAGFVITGEAPKRVVVRGVGPGLGEAVGTPLADPALQVWKLNTATGRWALVGENDDWDSTPATADLFESLGMGALVAGSKDAAVVLTLEPGIYTAQARGVEGATGVGLVELYEAP